MRAFRVRRLPEQLAPIFEQAVALLGRPLILIGEIVRRSRERVDRGDVRPPGFRQQKRRYGKVLVVRPRDTLAIRVGVREIGGNRRAGGYRHGPLVWKLEPSAA